MNDRLTIASEQLAAQTIAGWVAKSATHQAVAPALAMADSLLAAAGERDNGFSGVTHEDLCRCEAAWVSKLVTADAEIAALKAEVKRLLADNVAVRDMYLEQHAELARWKGPLTDEQEFEIWDAYEACGDERHPVKFIDAAVREVRGK